MSMFINGLKYIIPCQSQFSGKSIEQLVSEQYQSISTTVKNCLKDHRIPAANKRAEGTFQALRCILHELQSKKLSRKLEKRAKREYKIVQSIRRLLRDRSDVVIRRTDKKAYQEITSGRCPLSDMLYAVQTSLSSLVAQKALSFQQYSKISQKLNKLELGHYHGLPKPHKVGTPLREMTFINGIDVIRKL
ncbi:unnamed protein product, partial [Rotaria sordida]